MVLTTTTELFPALYLHVERREGGRRKRERESYMLDVGQYSNAIDYTPVDRPSPISYLVCSCSPLWVLG